MLQPFVEETGCGFEIDPDRPELLALVSQTIKGTLGLAGTLMDRLENFKRINQ